jgi:hypothetical protein
MGGQAVGVTGSPRYDVGEGMTAFDEELGPLLAGLPTTPVELCAVAQGLVALPDLAASFGIPDERHEERSIRPASAILRALCALDDRPLVEERAGNDRVVGTCRHFAVLAGALLRHLGIAARVRCGFATYFEPGRYLDHWIVEYRAPSDDRWVRVDAEILGFDFVDQPEDLAAGEFLSGGEAWTLCRQDGADPAHFGVPGYPDNWGIGEVRGNAVRDLAALNKVELLPWDAWGRMEASYDGRTGAAYDALMDRIAETCAGDDGTALADLYGAEDLTAPAALLV